MYVCVCGCVCVYIYIYIYESPFAEVDVVALIQCTSPFLNSAFLAEAYSKMQNGKYDSVFSVTREYKLRWKELPGMIRLIYSFFFKIMLIENNIHTFDISHLLLGIPPP
jgi:hypothetical protein